jgi:hypothetical protein
MCTKSKRRWILFEGITIPNRCEVSWQPPKGNFNWLNLEVIDIKYNISL